MKMMKTVATKSKKGAVKRRKCTDKGTIHIQPIGGSTDQIVSTYQLNPNGIQQAVMSVMQFVRNNPKLKNQLWATENFVVFLTITLIKVPKLYKPSAILKLRLNTSILSLDQDDICLIVADAKHIRHKDHDLQEEHYRAMLEKIQVKGIKKIMSFHELVTEYETFEMKRRLVDLYDCFLVDSKVCGKTVGKCGKIFYKKRKVPRTVRLEGGQIKNRIQRALSYSPLHYHGKGDSYTIECGHSRLSSETITANILSLIGELDKKLPGGFGNCRHLCVTAHRSISIPIYSSFKCQNDVDASLNQPQKPKDTTVYGELSTYGGRKVKVGPEGDVTVLR